MFDWDAKQYLKFESERTRPAIDLLSRIPACAPRKILDVGCGPGNSTGILAQRFSGAEILGIDNSPNMIEKAKAEHPSLSFALCDASQELETLGNDYDIVFSNACIQWIPNHPGLLRQLLGRLCGDGVLAVQTPCNEEEPIQKILQEVARRPKWVAKFQEPTFFHNLKPDEYYDLLAEISSSFAIWQTVYFHVLNSCQDILEWYRSTGLKPYLSMLSETEKAEFEKDIYAELTQAYPVQKDGKVIFRFPRLFFTASPGGKV